MFLNDLYNARTNLLPTAYQRQLPHRGLNDSQQQALELSLKYRLTVIHGPAVTGKTQTLTAIICEMLANFKNKRPHLLVIATQHVAVKALYTRCKQEIRRLWPSRPVLFVRLYSLSQIITQYLTQDEALQDPCHIDNQRLAIAMKERRKHAAFISGREELMQRGEIVGEPDVKAYGRCLSQIDEVVCSLYSMGYTCPSPMLISYS